jgi:hypothetical protein
MKEDLVKKLERPPEVEITEETDSVSETSAEV